MALLRKAISNSYRAFSNRDAFLLFIPNKVDKVCKNNLNFKFHYYNPLVNNTSTNPPTIEKRDRLMPPYEPYIELGHFDKNGAKHFLIINRYQFFPGHLIMVRDNQSELQGSPLVQHDYCMLSQLLHQVDDHGVAYYNGGVDAGCTQYHKHMQYVPSFKNPLFPNIYRNEKLPVKYYVRKLSDYSPETIGYNYLKLMEKMDHSGSYNFLISQKIAMIFPRRQARHKTGVLVNSMGVLGHFFVNDFNAKEAERDPIGILKSVCVPNE